MKTVSLAGAVALALCSASFAGGFGAFVNVGGGPACIPRSCAPRVVCAPPVVSYVPAPVACYRPAPVVYYAAPRVLDTRPVLCAWPR